jgi:prenylcysteine alpha-carboxyl methylesterase
MGFATFLSPAFLRIAWFYYTDRRVKRDILYGGAPRNRLDLYLPAGGGPVRVESSLPIA